MLLVFSVSTFFFTAYQLRTHPGAMSVGSAIRNFDHSDSAPGVHAPVDNIPRAGVYTMTGHGIERISVLSLSQTDGAVMPVTVDHLASGCWRWRLDYNEAHWEDYVFCASGSGVRQPSSRVYEKWDLGAMSISNLATITCPANTVVLPKDPVPGSAVSWACPERNTATGSGLSATTARIIGPATIRIGGISQSTVEELQTGTLSGTQTGSVTAHWWFAVSTGLPVRVDRNIVVHTTSPIGTITYTDEGWGQLTSLSPRTR